MSGMFPGIRKALVERGWVENEDKTSLMWNLKYALYQRDIGELSELDDMQVTNYFARNSELTSKAGLCNTLYSCCHMHQIDVDEFYPRCFDLTSAVQASNFVEDFKATSCRCMLRRFVEGGGRTLEGGAARGYPRASIAAALAVCQRRCAPVDDTLDDVERPLITDDEWREVGMWSLKTVGKRLKPWKSKNGQPESGPAPAHDAAAGGEGDGIASAPRDDAGADDAGGQSDGSDDEAPAGAANRGAEAGRTEEDEGLYIAAQRALDQLQGQQCQFHLDGFQNIWVLKPAGKSRGRGIQLSARLEKILEVGVGRGAEARWIAQKYIENPLIVQNKKFDIRQWVLVTRWNPLAAWFYEDCYVRFSFADYDPKKLKNRYAHLTNNSISKHAEGFEEQQDDTMWHSDDLREHLAGLGILRDGRPVADPWEEIVHPAMKQVVLQSLQCAQDNVLPRANSFELFGYDFMISEDLKVWLIEVNSSPDLSYSTSTTKVLVKAMIEDMMRVVVDVEKFGTRADRPKRKWGNCSIDTGRYSLLDPRRRRREEKFGRVRKEAGQLSLTGSAVKLRKPKRAEAARLAEATEDPRFDAAALLEAAATAAAEAGNGEEEDEDAEDAAGAVDEDDEDEDDDEGA